MEGGVLRPRLPNLATDPAERSLLTCDGRWAQLSDLQIGPAHGPIALVAALGRPIGATVQTYQFSDMKQLVIVLFSVSVAEIAVQSLDS
jgi:hypothetical protein